MKNDNSLKASTGEIASDVFISMSINTNVPGKSFIPVFLPESFCQGCWDIIILNCGGVVKQAKFSWFSTSAIVYNSLSAAKSQQQIIHSLME